MMPRRLAILDFEDFRTEREARGEEDNLRAQYGQCVDISIVHSFRAAQERLRSPRDRRADVILLDVMGENDATVAGPPTRWPLVGGHDLRPFVPILALPYIGAADYLALVPWSANWDKLLKDPEPMTWVALGLTLSRFRGRVLEWANIAREIGSVKAYTSVSSAMAPAVREYRGIVEKAIMDREVAVLPGVTDLVRRLTALKDSAAALGVSTSTMPAEEFSVRLQFPSGREEIWVESLFGDLLGWLRAPVSLDAYDEIIAWFDDKAICEREYSAAVKALNLIPDIAEPIPERGQPVPEVVRTYGSGQSGSPPAPVTARTAMNRQNGKPYPKAVLAVANLYALEEGVLHALEAFRSTKKSLCESTETALVAFLATLPADGGRTSMARVSGDNFKLLLENVALRREQPLDRAVKCAVPDSSREEERHAVKNLCVVLAHVKAYSAPEGTLRDKVMHALGFVDDNSYRGLFANGRGSSAPTKNQANKKLKPFDETATDPKEQFYLHAAAPPLGVTMRGLCQEYARHELRWTDEDQWPDWMK